MMTMKNSRIKGIMLYVLTFLFLVSCSENDEILCGNDKSNDKVQSERISIEEAMQIAEESAALFHNKDKKVNADGAAFHYVEEKHMVKAVCDGATTRSSQSAAEDTLLYLVDYKDDMGFAIISASRETPSLLGIVENGNSDMQELAENENFVFLLENMKEYVRSHPGIPITPVYSYIYEVEAQVSPMLEVCWGQRGIEGDDCPNGIAGCAPIAIAQLMSYYSYPENIDILYGNSPIYNYSLDWDDMKGHVFDHNVIYGLNHCIATNGAHPMITKLCRQLGYSAGSLYLTNKTSTTQSGMLSCLMDYGYDVTTSWLSYSQSSLVSSLNSSRPVIMIGQTTDSIGHAWVVDGYKYYKITKTYTFGDYPDEITYSYYNHINWGWDGRANGYFLQNVFSTNSPYNNAYDYIGSITNYNFTLTLRQIAPYPIE